LDWPAPQCCDLAMERLKKIYGSSVLIAGSEIKMESVARGRIKHVKFTGGGHLIEPPFMPNCTMSYFNIVSTLILWGGDPILHPVAQKRAWYLLLNHFSSTLSRKQPNSNL